MSLKNLFAWTKKNNSQGSSCGAACGAKDKPAEAPKKPAACGAACGAGDKK